MDSFILLLLVISGALISGIAGIGGGVLILSGLMLVYPPAIALPLHSFSQLATNSFRTGLHFRQVDWRLVGVYCAPMIPAALVAAVVFNSVNAHWLKLLIGSFIVVTTLPFKLKPKAVPALRTFFFLGVLTGAIGVFVGAVGPLVVPFFARLNRPRENIVSTIMAGQAFFQVSKLVAFWQVGVPLGDLTNHISIILAGSLAGVLLAMPLSKKISDRRFAQLVAVLMFLIGSKLVYEGVRGLLSA